MALCSMGMTVALLALLEVRAQWKQREDLNRLLILALFRMSKRQIGATEEQTRHIDALLQELRAGRLAGRLDPARLADIRREVDAAALHENEGAEIAAEEEIMAEEDPDPSQRSESTLRRAP